MNEIQSEKVNALRDIILDRADGQKRVLLKQAKGEAEAWSAQEADKLEMEADLIIQDARKRSDEIRRRQVLSAEKERATEALRLQNRLLGEAMNMLQDELVRLREREDYPSVLAGMAIESIKSAGTDTVYKISLAAADVTFGEKIVAIITAEEPGMNVSLNPEPIPILGGIWVVSEDGRRRVNADWRQKASELADILAERLIPLL